MLLKGRTVVVTGAAGGIGGATAACFARAGARVAGLDLQQPKDAMLGLACDMGDDAEVDRAAERVIAELGVPDIVVHAAAISETGSAANTPSAAYRSIYNVNVIGAVRLLHAFAPQMCARGEGVFLFVSSINARFATPGLAAYAASKAALDSLMRTAALELASNNVRVNTVQPASIDTPLLRGGFDRAANPAAARATNILRHPLGRLGTADDVANLILFLASPEAAWITGCAYGIDGGAGITRR